MYKILIVTAECGEPQFNSLLDNLKIQNGITYKHIIISNKSTIEAESEIYNLFKYYNSKTEYQWFLRLDADMNFTSQNSILTLLKYALNKNDIFRISVPLMDYYTGCQIMGVHLIKLGIIIDEYEIKEFIPERWIDKIHGVNFLKLQDSLFTHGFNSDIDQCIRFGLLRGLKAVYSGPRGIHWITIFQIQKNLMKNFSDEKIWITYYSALIGAGYIHWLKLSWNFVDKKSENNHLVKEFIINDLIKFKLTNYIFIIYKLHYKNYKSLYETVRFILKSKFYN